MNEYEEMVVISWDTIKDEFSRHSETIAKIIVDAGGTEGLWQNMMTDIRTSEVVWAYMNDGCATLANALADSAYYKCGIGGNGNIVLLGPSDTTLLFPSDTTTTEKNVLCVQATLYMMWYTLAAWIAENAPKFYELFSSRAAAAFNNAIIAAYHKPQPQIPTY